MEAIKLLARLIIRAGARGGIIDQPASDASFMLPIVCAARSAVYWVTGIAGVLTAVAAGRSHAAPQQDGTRTAASTYADVCTFCHDGNVGPDLRGRGLNATYVRFIVRNGLNAMPAFRTAEIDDTELGALADYVSALQPERR